MCHLDGQMCTALAFNSSASLSAMHSLNCLLLFSNDLTHVAQTYELMCHLDGQICVAMT